MPLATITSLLTPGIELIPWHLCSCYPNLEEGEQEPVRVHVLLLQPGLSDMASQPVNRAEQNLCNIARNNKDMKGLHLFVVEHKLSQYANDIT